MKLGVERFRQPDRLKHGQLCTVRAVGAHHNRFRHVLSSCAESSPKRHNRSVLRGATHTSGSRDNQERQRSSRSDRLELCFGHSEVPKSVLPFGVRLVVDDQAVTPPHNLGKRHVYLSTAFSSAAMRHHERERTLAQIEIRFGPNLNLSPCVIYFCEVPSQSAMPAVVGAADGPEERMELDLLIAQRDRSFYVPTAERRVKAAVKLDIPLGHAFSLGRDMTSGHIRT